MKVEFGQEKPEELEESWPGEYSVFNWMEYVTAIPQPMFLVTTYKEEEVPNACLHAWSTFTGEGGDYYCILSILKDTHTYANISRDEEFCLNFVAPEYWEQCKGTIQNNEQETDEITESGLNLKEAQVISAPRIEEAFLNLECKLEWEKELHPGSQWIILAGSVQQIALEEEFAEGDAEKRLEEFGFLYNIHSPTDPIKGIKHDSKVGELKLFTGEK